MVRNLVLTPFIDLAFAHFMFSLRKSIDFFAIRQSVANKARIPTRLDHRFPICADKPIDRGVSEGKAA